MYGLDKRVKRFVQELEKLIYRRRQPVAGLRIRRGALPRGINPIHVTDGWEPYGTGSPWAVPGADDYAVFRAEIRAEMISGRSPVLLCRSNKSGWNAGRPQFLLYVNGRIRQAFDTNHLMAKITAADLANGACLIHCAAFGGFRGNWVKDDGTPVEFYLDLADLDEDVWNLYYDLCVPLMQSRHLASDSIEWQQTFAILNHACSLVDWRDPDSAIFRQSILEAHRYLNTAFYQHLEHVLPATVSCVGHTHIDVAWLWRYSHTREKTVRSFATALSLIDEYPDFHFMSSQPQLFQFLKEDYPDFYEEVRQRVLDGRFEVEGGMWVESDTNLPSGESLVRQFLHGKRFMRDEFGVESRILWLPDVFGYSAALPQIMKKSGIDYFMTSKLKNNELNKMPHHTFLWQGIDGSTVLTQLTSYNPSFYNGQAQNAEMTECWREYQDKALTNDVLYTYGYGDGGGGPTREMIETIQRFKQGVPGGPRARFCRAGDFFKTLDRKVSKNRNLATWRGELYYEFHRGTYTSMARNKRHNRQAEFLLTCTEWASVFRQQLLGGGYPAAELDRCWKILLLNQFHDVLPGSSIEAVYQDTDELYAQLFQTANGLLAQATGALASCLQLPAGSLVVFNPLSWERTAPVTFRAPEGEWSLSDGQRHFPAQKCHTGEYVALVSGIPSTGWLALQMVQPVAGDTASRCKNQKSDGFVRASASCLENAHIRVRLNHQGNIRSLYDKHADREVFQPGTVGNRLIAFEDKPAVEDNWNLDVYYSEKSWDIPAKSIEVLEQGPVRAIIRIRRDYLHSSIVQDLILWQNSPRLDIRTEIDWKDQDTCLKAQFTPDVNADLATYEIQFGHICRNTHANTSWDQAKFEVCAHKWADLGDHGYGFSLLNDGKYGHDACDGNLRLTLLRSGCYPNPAADKETHQFTYAIYPHPGNWRTAGTVRQAYELNVPAIVVPCGGNEGGLIASQASFAVVSSENIILETIKQAEDGDGMILRLYEAWNQSGTCEISFYTDLETAAECDLQERRLDNAYFTGNTLKLSYKPFEIKTFRIKLKPDKSR